MKILKLFNIFLISITIITSGCSGLEYGKSVNSIEIKYDNLKKYRYENETATMMDNLKNPKDMFHYSILPIGIAITIILIGLGITAIVEYSD